MAISQNTANEISTDTVNTGNKLAFWNFFVAFAAFALALPMGAYQVLERSGLFPAIDNAAVYYASTSSHGVLMAYVLSTFFIMGFGYHTAIHSLKMKLWSPKFAWTGFGVATFGVALAAVPLLTGNASVLYTFYPPEMAHATFYIGAALLVVGSWFWAVDMIVQMVLWKKQNPGKPVPVIMFGTVMNALLWLWTSAWVASEVVFQLIPAALGFNDTLDPGLARTLFSGTLHAIVYFWLFPAYLVMYSILPKEAGGKLFSDEMARVAFVMLFIFSVPIGFHHLYMDPMQADGWKLLHMFGTFLVAAPTLLTGFTVIASMEIAGRLRGGKGLFGWIKAMDCKNPVVLAGCLSLLMLTVGGWGGVINASYALDSLIHNTQWIPGHFHLIYGGTTVIMYFAAAYWLWPKITGRHLFSPRMARVQLWAWFIGMWVTTIPWHYLGIIGQPRRVDTLQAYQQAPELVASWDFSMLIMNAGALTLLFSGLLFVYLLIRSTMSGRVADGAEREVEYAEAIHQPFKVPNLLNSLTFWNWAMFFYLIASYGYPVLQFFLIGTPESILWGE
ncbi:cbb3-type cytochrome c oxidase subunit I [Thiomicrorhabdus sp. Milos-T2]|uniref:cbb3-type cytochrome c oxidase subunit I n=1 Tax=Thiomicrorhabdus sp. Milos-T2 TaxID=90814 RepID=UPI000690BF84|nr:cbb3-type cytochrome c oxidase subunit I [Thiomicrorhabdus sp. Milos-T2]